MKVLLTHPYILAFDEKQRKASTPYPPLATLYAAALLRKHGITVGVCDLQFAESADEIEKAFSQFCPDVLVIYEDGFNYLNKMCLLNMRNAAFKMIQCAKIHQCKIAVSSSDATDHIEKYLNAGADFILRGEGEITLLELIREIENESGSYRAIGGLSYCDKSEIIHTKSRQVMKVLDDLPFPAWDLIDLKPYRNMWLQKQGYFSINLVTTRGCPYTCNWCAKPIYGNRYNAHTPQYILNLIKNMQEHIKIDHFWFADDIFGLKPDWIKDFSETKERMRLEFRYKIQSRADLLLKEDTVKYLKESGCESVWMGAESGSQKILDKMEKGTQVQQIYDSVSLLKKNNILACLFLQFGYPGENTEDINLTLKMLKDLMPDDIGISISYPLPGTPFYESVKNLLSEKKNWTHSDDLDLMFRDKKNGHFYRTLHRFVHNAYRGRQSLRLCFQNPTWKKIKAKGLKRTLGFPFYYTRAVWYRAKLSLIK